MKDSISDELKNFSDMKPNQNKFDFDLYKDESNIVEKLFRIKYFSTSKSEKWKVFEDNKQIFIIERYQII